MKLNLNETVRVRLTPKGRVLHRLNHDKMYEDWTYAPDYRPVEETADGWSTWQLWDLAREFGPHLYNGCDLPFETEIEISSLGDGQSEVQK